MAGQGIIVRQEAIEYQVSPAVTNDDLNELFTASWPGHTWSDFAPRLARSLTYICAYAGQRLVGFMNLAWDGGIHAFILDTTVHPDLRRRGVGTCMVEHALRVARERGVAWVHVDFEPHLEDFYRGCGFRPTDAGLVHLEPSSREQSSDQWLPN